MLDRLLLWDRRLGHQLYKLRTISPYGQAASLLGLSADEAVWFPLPLLCILIGVLPLQTGCELFGDLCIVAFIEQLSKVAFKRTRPAYQHQGSFYCIWGEWFSLPSGHALRAAYLGWRMYRGGWTGHLAGADWRICLLWSAGVGWARVVAGKHYPLDALLGLLLGCAVAEGAVLAGPARWGSIKLVAGALFVLELAPMVVLPRLRLQGTIVHIVCGLLWLISLQYTELPDIFRTSNRIAN